MVTFFAATLTAAVFSCVGCTGGNNIAHPDVVREKIKKGSLIVDVRTPEEYQSGHYEGAINIPLGEIPQRLLEFGDKNRSIVVYCRTGNRSNKARTLLMQNGFTDVINGGGMKDMSGILNMAKP